VQPPPIEALIIIALVLSPGYMVFRGAERRVSNADPG